MDDRITLSAKPREVTGKAVKQLRRAGIIPVVVYGGPLDGAVALNVDERELNRVLNVAGAARVIDLKVDGSTYPVLAREVQRHPTRLEIIHVDFLAVRMDRLIQADVRVFLVGDTTAVDENPDAIMTQVADRVTVEALPDKLPSSIEIDVSHLSEVGQTITVADIQLPSDVTIISDPETLIVSVATPLRAPVEEEEEEEVAEMELPEGEEAEVEADEVEEGDEE